MSTTKALSKIAAAFGTQLDEPTVLVWREALADAEPDAIERAADEWIANERWAPKPADIRKAALVISSEAHRAPAEPEHYKRDTFACGVCTDTGLVEVWHPQTIRDIRAEKQRFKYRTVVVRCKCNIGSKHPLANPPKRGDGHQRAPLPQLTSRICVRLRGSFRNAVEAMHTWVSDPSNLPNYVSEFEEWNAQ